MSYWTGRAAFVTGGGSGIGRQIALELGRRGAAVAVADIDPAAAEAVAAEVAATGARAAGVQLDISDPAAWDRALAAVAGQLGQPTDCLVNCAGIGGGCNVADEDVARWRRVLEVTLFGTFYGCHAVLRPMLDSGKPCNIVNIASLSGFWANPGMSAYTTAKFGVVGLTDTLRLELDGTNVTVTIVYPGMVNTGFVQNSRKVLGEADAEAEGGKPTGVGNMLADGMDPDKLARRVIDGAERGEYHVFTHSEWKERIKSVFDERLAAFGVSADPDYVEDFAALSERIAETQRQA